MENVHYQCWLDENRMAIDYLTGTCENSTQKLSQDKGKAYFYYEGQMTECNYRKTNTLRLIPHGYGTLYSIYDLQVIVSCDFNLGQVEGFTNVIIPSKNIDISCTYKKGVPDTNVPYLMFKNNKVKLAI